MLDTRSDTNVQLVFSTMNSGRNMCVVSGKIGAESGKLRVVLKSGISGNHVLKYEHEFPSPWREIKIDKS